MTNLIVGEETIHNPVQKGGYHLSGICHRQVPGGDVSIVWGGCTRCFAKGILAEGRFAKKVDMWCHQISVFIQMWCFFNEFQNDLRSIFQFENFKTPWKFMFRSQKDTGRCLWRWFLQGRSREQKNLRAFAGHLYGTHPASQPPQYLGMGNGYPASSQGSPFGTCSERSAQVGLMILKCCQFCRSKDEKILPRCIAWRGAP